MTDDPRDARDLWQKQKTENQPMLLEVIRHKAQDLEERARREVWVSYAVTFAIAAVAGYRLVVTDDGMLRIGCGLLVAGALAYFMQAARRKPAALPHREAGLLACLDYYRRELVSGGARNWRVLLAFVPGVAVILLSAARRSEVRETFPWVRFAPFFSALAVWAILFVWLRRQKASQLQRELDLIDAMKREIDQ
jgi:hypothetical protein